ncbi:protease propeptide/inhibitor [Trichocladium antarcticum]|uniref:Protease propeptide/inhibitor n=1 Tax=Trichocladium antarcticum TaxID=1450529 RepID=A0AAN6UC91_9PEZI|nr:protease propeptide/inhibitor [Trichocladium antarcticum]
MPSYIVTLKKDATDEQVAAAKDEAKKQGGTIGHEYSLIKGFQVTFDEGSVNALQSHEHVDAVELDREVRTQS